MADFPSLPLWTDAYIADTQHLTNEEHGVYLRLLMFAWRTPLCELPDDDKRFSIMVGVTPKKWAKLKPVIMSFWSLREGVWTQKKLTKERKYVEGMIEQKRAAGKASAKARSLKNKEAGSTAVTTGKPTGSQREANTHTHTHTHKPPTPSAHTPQGEKKSKPKPKNGTRLSEQWKPSEADYQVAYNEGFNHEQANRTADKFRDYWIAKTGAQATKLDWPATWRNWIRREADNGNKKNQPRRNTAHENLAQGFAQSADKHQRASGRNQDADEIPI